MALGEGIKFPESSGNRLAARRLEGARMSIRVMDWIWRCRIELRGSLLIVALALADWASEDGGDIFPSIKTLASKARISPREARRIVARLEASHFLVRERSGAGRENHARWRINLTLPETGQNRPVF